MGSEFISIKNQRNSISETLKIVKKKVLESVSTSNLKTTAILS